MELGRNNLKYIAGVGIKPYFKDILKTEITAFGCFSISFDQSLYKTVHESGLWNEFN